MKFSEDQVQAILSSIKGNRPEYKHKDLSLDIGQEQRWFDPANYIPDDAQVLVRPKLSIVDGLFDLTGRPTTVIGMPGSCKSTLMTSACYSLMATGKFAGFSINKIYSDVLKIPVKCAYFCAEGFQEVQQTMTALNDRNRSMMTRLQPGSLVVMGPAYCDMFKTFSADGWNADSLLYTAFGQTVQSMFPIDETRLTGLGIVVIDCFSAANALTGGRVNEMDAVDTRKAIDTLDEFCKRFNCHLVIIDHTAKDQSTGKLSSYGSVQKTGAFGHVIHVIANERDDMLRHVK